MPANSISLASLRLRGGLHSAERIQSEHRPQTPSISFGPLSPVRRSLVRFVHLFGLLCDNR